MKTLHTLAMTFAVLLAGFGIVNAQDSAKSTNQETFSHDAIHTAEPVKQIHVMRLRGSLPSADRLSAPLRRRARTSHALKPLNAGTITYTCDPNVAAATCNYLNTTIAGDYSSTFTNANANIYIQYGTTGLGESEQYFNFVTYSQYVAALTGNSNQSAVQAAALSALNTYDASPYGSDNVEISGALGTALGFTGLTGITTGGGDCTLGNAGCYNAIITITNDPGTPLYYDNVGGSEPSDAFDFYGVVEHETDEVLGTSSCIDTQDGGVLSDPCDYAGGSGTPAAVDLFRYNSAGELALNSSYLGLASAPAEAYFSYNGGTTNGANGVANTAKVYNTLANDEDYADFVSSSPDCGTDIAIQDAEGCPGEDAGLTILNDGGGEINILNAVGYDVPTQACAAGTYSSTGDAPCTPAPAGSYVAESGATSATPCAAGSYQPSTGQTSCLLAPAGSYVSTVGAITATLCSAGNYQPSTGQISCIAAPAGTYVATTGSALPINCPVGYYQPYSGQTSCLAAPAGSYVSLTGAILATLCSLGRYQPNTGQAACLFAQPGSYVSTTGAISATLCSPGSYQPNAGQFSCIASPAGSSVPTSGATVATPCAAGSYQPSTGQTSCIASPAGSYVSTSGATGATLCPAGSYQPSTGQASCLLAPAGSFVSTTGAIVATPCVAGTYQPSTGQTSCLLAPAGSYVSTTGAIVATPCAAGSYQPSTGQVSCILAAIGYFVASPGQTSETQCPAGETTLAPGATYCVAVSPVTVSPASLTFGDLYVGDSEAFQVTLKNTGSTKVPIGPISFTVTAGDASQFSYHEFCQASLPAGRVCTVKVTFAPDAAGSDAATLNIVAGSSTIQVPLAASGKSRKK
ncbi:MAG: NF038122 family metalloprotease [Terriglobales bacterium]